MRRMIYSEDKASFFSAIRARMRTMLLFEGKEPTYRRLDGFVGKCALRKPVLKKPADEKEEL